MTSKSKSILKYLFAGILLLLILHNTDVGKIGRYLTEISPANLALALLMVTLAQFTAALRMRYFFNASGFALNAKYAVLLFYVGAFYNFLLPGGIGGDAYKVMLARKRMQMPAMQGIRIMVADRASGLCIVMMMLFAALYTMDLSRIIPYANWLIAVSAVITLICYLGISKIFLKQPPKVMLCSLHYSLSTQLLWVATLWAMWKSLGNGKNFIEYIALYCAASITALLPISVGGLGIKESTYYYGAKMIQDYGNIPVDGELGVALSLCIFALSFIACLPGTFMMQKVSHAHIHTHQPQHES